MFRKRWPLVLGALAVLFAGLTNAHAHVHLCFDGQEPPASVHGAHGEHGHHELDEAGDHDDLDVDLEGQALAKSLKPDLPLVLPAVLGLLPPAQRSAAAAIVAADDAVGPDPPFLRPLLRAPPALV